MQRVTVCVPVLNRYDCLEELALSLEAEVVDRLIVIDNGQNRDRTFSALRPCPDSIRREVVVPDVRLGVAASWNVFRTLTADRDERLIVNDDIVFTPGDIAKILAAEAPFVSVGFGFSCFLLRDECVRRVGLFDESISPGYAYFEDRDYYRRMKAAGIKDIVVQTGILHKHSATLAAFTAAELEDHHRKFVVAQENFLAKWGELDPDTPRQFYPGVNA